MCSLKVPILVKDVVDTQLIGLGEQMLKKLRLNVAMIALNPPVTAWRRGSNALTDSVNAEVVSD